MAFGVELPDDARRERILLSIWYRARHSAGFRRKDERRLGELTDIETGIEFSKADLRAPGDAIRGPEFVFQSAVDPQRLAEETLLREEVDGSKPSLGQVRALRIVTHQPDLAMPGTTKEVYEGSPYPMHESGRAEEELSRIQREFPQWNASLRTVQGHEAWTEEEAEAVAEMKYRWQRTMLAFAEKGWLKLESPVVYDSPDQERNQKFSRGVDDKGMPYLGVCTPAGLDEAEMRIASDPIYSQGAFSALEAMPGELRAKVASKSPWAMAKWNQESATGDAP